MRYLDLFSGIGGFSLAAQWVWGDDLEIVAFCEIDKFCQKILKKHWPEVPIIEDIRKVEWVVTDTAWIQPRREEQRPIGKRIRFCFESPIDLLTGGFPCQPASCAGKRAGTKDDRWLWPEMLRAICEIKPRWVVAENVPGLLSLQDGVVFEGVCIDLEAEGYEVQSVIVPACAAGAPHRRDRIWIVAHAQDSFDGGVRRRGHGNPRRSECSLQIEGSDHHAPNSTSREAFLSEQSRLHPQSCSKDRDVTDTDRLNGNNAGYDSGEVSQFKKTEISRCRIGWQKHWYEVATRFCRVDDGFSRRMDRVNRLKALGNAIVPQIAEQIFRAIKELDEY